MPKMEVVDGHKIFHIGDCDGKLEFVGFYKLRKVPEEIRTYRCNKGCLEVSFSIKTCVV